MPSIPESPSPSPKSAMKSSLKSAPRSPRLTYSPMPPTPPLTPTSPLPAEQSPAVKIHTPVRIPDDPLPESKLYSLHTPLKAHLALAHPNTPPSVVSFCARRLLSPDIPHGFESDWEWKPIHLQENGLDLRSAGVGKDAGKYLREGQKGPGKKADEKLEKMYEVARSSWRLLESKVPTRGCAL
ncbi:hypothetical protein IAR50_005515 [Cryptococcus sp. DSM 104548]